MHLPTTKNLSKSVGNLFATSWQYPKICIICKPAVVAFSSCHPNLANSDKLGPALLPPCSITIGIACKKLAPHRSHCLFRNLSHTFPSKFHHSPYSYALQCWTFPSWGKGFWLFTQSMPLWMFLRKITCLFLPFPVSQLILSPCQYITPNPKCYILAC